MTKKRKRLSTNDKLEILNKYKGHCAYCGRDITLKNMHIDHIKPACIYSELDEEGALTDVYNPSCRACSYYKSTLDMEMFRDKLKHTVFRILKNSSNYRLALQYGFISENNIGRVEFYFEKLEKEECILRHLGDVMTDEEKPGVHNGVFGRSTGKGAGPECGSMENKADSLEHLPGKPGKDRHLSFNSDCSNMENTKIPAKPGKGVLAGHDPHEKGDMEGGNKMHMRK